MKIELFANYALRSLLPKEVSSLFPKQISPTKGNTILLYFNDSNADCFLSACRKYGFEYRIL